MTSRWCLVLALGSCAGPFDVVASLGSVPLGAESDGAVAKPDARTGGVDEHARCDDSARGLLGVDDAGTLLRLSSDFTATPLGQPHCARGMITGAIDQDGLVWASDGRTLWWIVSSNGLCIASALPWAPTAMAFVYHPETKRELLYALVDGALRVIEPASQVSQELGMLQADQLAGTPSGGLYAFSRPSADSISFARVDARTASLDRAVTLRELDAGNMVGASWRDGEWLTVVDTTVYRIADASNYSRETLPYPLRRVLSSTCSSLAK